MRRSGIAVKAGDTIPYIYCIKPNTHGEAVEREPRMPDDVYCNRAVIGKLRTQKQKKKKKKACVRLKLMSYCR